MLLYHTNSIKRAESHFFCYYFSAFEIIHPIVFHDTDLSNQNSIPSNRRKRSALWDTDQISVNISTINDHFQIKLKPNKHLLSPGFKVYHRRHGGEGHVTTEVDIISTSDDTACHFHGVIESHGQAKAALSLCRGVVSLFQFHVYPQFQCMYQAVHTDKRSGTIALSLK